MASRALQAAAALALLLAVAALIDQLSGRTLAAHTVAMYRGHGVEVDPNLPYVMTYLAAGVLVVLWGAAIGIARLGRLWGLGATVSVTAVNGAVALTLALVTEYGERVFPPLWGVIAALPAIAGVVATVRLARGRTA